MKTAAVAAWADRAGPSSAGVATSKVRSAFLPGD